jgi:hypothetical protein
MPASATPPKRCHLCKQPLGGFNGRRLELPGVYPYAYQHYRLEDCVANARQGTGEEAMTTPIPLPPEVEAAIEKALPCVPGMKWYRCPPSRTDGGHDHGCPAYHRPAVRAACHLAMAAAYQHAWKSCNTVPPGERMTLYAHFIDLDTAQRAAAEELER